MKMFNFRTKFEVVGAIFMIAILLTACVLGGTRIISDSRDNSVTFITNSNGGKWDATGANIGLAYADLTGGGTVTLPGNTTITINSGFIPKKNTTLDFNGCKLLLDDLGVEQTYMINMYNDNVTLIDPWLDMDRANNEVNPAVGSQIAIYFNGRSHNCEIIGGLIENACQSGIGGATHNATIIGTKILDSGEHGVYLSQSSDVYMQGVEVIEPGVNNTVRGYGFKLDRVKSTTLENIYVEYTGHEVFPGDQSIGVVIGGGSRSVKVHGRIVRATYGIYPGSSSYNGRPCENLEISLSCEGCKVFANDATPSDLISCHVHDSFMDIGTFKLDAFGEHGIIEGLTVNHSGDTIHTNICSLTSASQNVSFTLKDSFIRANTGYAISITTGHDLVIENNIIINDNTSPNNYCCLRLSDVTGKIRVDDNTFKGGSHWNIRYDSANENFLCSGNRFREPYAGDTSGTAIEWIKYPTYRCIEGNINQSDIIARDTYIRNSDGKYYEPTGANIQNAIDDLTNGGEVLLPSGTFDLVSTNTKRAIEISGNINLIGRGNSTILNLTSATGASSDIIRIEGNNVLISNLQIDGNKDTNLVKYWTGIRIVDSSYNITVRSCYIHDIQHSMVRSGVNTSNILVEGCFLSECNTTSYPGGILFAGHDSIARNNFIKDTFACGVIFAGSSSYPAYNNIADGNIITGYVACGVYMEGSGYSHNCTIVNNIIYEINSTAYEVSESWFSKGIIMQTDTVCSNNKIIDVWDRGIQATGDNIISNNFIDDVGYSTSGYGITHNTGYCEIIGNEISNTASRAINGGSSIELVSNNHIHNSGSTAIHICDIVTSNIIDTASMGISSAAIASNNHITGVTTGIVPKYWSSTTGNYIEAVDRGIDTNGKDNCTISNNNIITSGGGSIGIDIDSSNNCTVTANIIDAVSKGIYEGGTSDWNIIGLNNCLACATPIDINGANTINTTNQGAIS